MTDKGFPRHAGFHRRPPTLLHRCCQRRPIGTPWITQDGMHPGFLECENSGAHLWVQPSVTSCRGTGHHRQMRGNFRRRKGGNSMTVYRKEEYWSRFASTFDEDQTYVAGAGLPAPLMKTRPMSPAALSSRQSSTDYPGNVTWENSSSSDVAQDFSRKLWPRMRIMLRLPTSRTRCWQQPEHS
jgi:hypothetical protein